MGISKIEWTDYSWNPIVGCSEISEGCTHCYAKRMCKRFGWPWKPTFHPDRLEEPLHWKKPCRIFVCSMGDIAHDNVSQHDFNLIIQIIIETPKHTYCLLTKRPNNLLKLFGDWKSENIKNLMLGVSVENQKTADERIPILLQIPAAKRFVSVEPMLGPVNFDGLWGYPGSATIDMLNRWPISWVICGGETGPRARSVHPDWVRSLLNQCQPAGVPFFFKQISGKQPIPKDLRIREFPK